MVTRIQQFPLGGPGGGGGGGGIVVGRAHLDATNLSTTAASIPYDNTAPQIGEGGVATTLSYTPVDDSGLNNLRIEGVIWLGAPAASVAGDVMTVAVFRSGVADALAAVGHEILVAGGQNIVVPIAVEIAGHTFSTLQTFQIRYGLSVARAAQVFNGDKTNAFRYGGTGTPKSSMTITEYVA